MKAAFVVAGGLFLGVLAHLGWYNYKVEQPEREFAANLEWMQETLELTPAQVERIQSLHVVYGPSFHLLVNKLSDNRKEAEKLEQVRQKDDAVDFLLFFTILEQQREIETHAKRTRQEFVSAVAQELKPEQKERFLGYLNAVNN